MHRENKEDNKIPGGREGDPDGGRMAVGGIGGEANV
jgi:hypothetical protein